MDQAAITFRQLRTATSMLTFCSLAPDTNRSDPLASHSGALSSSGDQYPSSSRSFEVLDTESSKTRPILYGRTAARVLSLWPPPLHGTCLLCTSCGAERALFRVLRSSGNCCVEEQVAFSCSPIP